MKRILGFTLCYFLFTTMTTQNEIGNKCVDIAPDNRYTCEQQASWGKCQVEWMINGNYCQKTCGRCSEACTDRQPEEFSCEQQARWGKCERPWMQNYCDKSCGRCSDNQDLDCSLATSLECDRIALLQFKSGMSSEAQELLSSWSTDNPCSGWKGIICRGVLVACIMKV
eukprot:TRINITY_DN1604_c0_g1_i12.p1 TRINITY_DN1604_c0_g1~~TRINITY_DN1604_c0_g1_i12.p1  ORF type:complete len:169 (+),score=4.08 TRINITY_DN1604_c0_g1_i12:84-590(+)